MNQRVLYLAAACALATRVAAVEPPEPYGAPPSEAQLNWHNFELYGLVCFNMPTFTNEEWAFGDKPAAMYNPTDFSADQIVLAAKAGGLRALVLVCKHHGGFCLWPTKTTEYSIKNSPYKGGRGDIVGELAEACRRHGLLFGAYNSPWDRNHAEYGRPAYVDAYREQWRELMTNYGELFELWLDGANGGTGWYGGAKGRRNIDRATYYDWPTTFEMMRELQPGAVIFSDIGPGCRWVGNEHGHAGDPCWATIDFPIINGKPAGPGMGISRKLLGSGSRDGTQWVPAEADVSIRPGWYYHPQQNGKVRTPQNLINLYFMSIGRGASLNLGLPPDTRGRMHDNDVDSLKRFGDWQRETFGENLAASSTAIASNVRGKDVRYAAERVIDGSRETYWCTDDTVLTPELTLDLGEDVEFNVVSLREFLPLGQRIDDWALDTWQDGRWVEFAKGTAVGSRRLVRTDYMTARKVRLRITKAAACPAVSEFALHREPEWARRTPITPDNPDLGMSKRGWSIHSCSYAAPGGGAAERAIDGNVRTLWHTHGPDGEHGAPHEVAIDMGGEVAIKSFLYMPRRDGTTRAIVDRYEYHVSSDGKTWTKAAAGEFGNIAANPIQQVVTLDTPAKARYFKFIALHSANGIPLCAAELGVLEAK
jgi:alpha-L-fucosidase